MSTAYAVVHVPAPLGTSWYEGLPHERLDPPSLLRVEVVPDRLHPRLVLPFSLLLWGSGGARTVPEAAVEVARSSSAEVLDRVLDEVRLPLPCKGSGRCEVVARDGRCSRGRPDDDAEAVAAALLHRGTCTWQGSRRPREVPRWWLPRGRSGRTVAEDALDTAALLQVVSADRRRRLLARTAGDGTSEDVLEAQWVEHLDALRGWLGFSRWKRGVHVGPHGTCPLCLADIAQTRPCPSCSAYVHEPDERSRTLDRIDVACGYAFPARPEL